MEKIFGLITSRTINFLAAFLLILMFFLAVFSLKDDSIVFDELHFIPAGYLHLTEKDYRMGIDHPPLATSLAAIPLLFLDLKSIPKDDPLWAAEGDPGHLWGSTFFYLIGNDPDQILFWARIPMILLLIFLGWFLFKWTRELAGNLPALLALFLFSFCPTFLAHGRLVATDFGATLGIFLAAYFYLKFLKTPDRKNIILSGLTLGAALLTKFSTMLLLPFFGIITLFFFWSKVKNQKEVLNYLKSIILIGVIAVSLIWLIYQFHMLNYPVERQLADTEDYLSYFRGYRSLGNLSLWMADKSVFRPIGHYLLGFLFNLQVARYGAYSITYFLGQVYQGGLWYYFPIVYLLKVPIALHILTLIALFTALWKIKQPFLAESGKRFKGWLLNHFPEFSMTVFLLIYWVTVIDAKINIGVKHLLPTFPFIYILASLGLKNWITGIETIKFKKTALFLILLLLAWYAVSSLSVFPYYLTYFNELAGGPKNGYKYSADSNLDYSQDLKRLARWVEEQEIEKIYIDYQSNAAQSDVRYYLGEKAIPWYGSSWWSWSGWQTFESFPSGNYFAISAYFLQLSRGEPVPGFDWPTGEYRWLNDYQPIAQIGNSIFVYYIY